MNTFEKLAPVGSVVEVTNVNMNGTVWPLVKGFYRGPMYRGSEKGKHAVQINGVVLYFNEERIRLTNEKDTY